MLYVLDACALFAFIKGETGDNIVWDVLFRSVTGDASAVMHEINLLAVYYGFYRERGKIYAELKIAEASAFFTTIQGLARPIFTEAGRLKASYKISLADSIALAEASISGDSLVTADHHELDAIEKHENINFVWIR
ncbi:MAG: PIN domain-containing protein [Synergistaceae bacterium]|jgi:PIN domain nuclease of toxin-antitoxin system|nr:PIN domain-containing protein [Synergistaceae bacterium]